MEEYIANGARLGWLIDSVDQRQRVYVYRPGSEVEVLERPDSISGEPRAPWIHAGLETRLGTDFLTTHAMKSDAEVRL